jgi:uncharacterized protein
MAGSDDVDHYGVEKCCGTEYVPFEGSYGFGPTYAKPEPLRPGQIVQVDIPLGPSATLFRAGEQLRLVVAGRWLWPHNPLTGQFPAAYEKGPQGTCTLRWGPDHPAQLLIPVIP